MFCSGIIHASAQNQQSCIELSNCPGLNWLIAIRNQENFAQELKRFACDDKQNTEVWCPTIEIEEEPEEVLEADILCDNAENEKSCNSTGTR